MFQMYSIFDKKGLIYGQPFYCRHVAEATRSVQIGIQDGKAMFARFPADYALYLVGTFDPDSGSVTPTHQGGPQFCIEVASLVDEKGGAA